ncbi:hypothetical protein [Actinoplanes sp. G11-F43]|uniref:hypothetical protein n=1 Tax=Actinoplanes sp. G11-F43 TaxID=3424130 RepID=UPI003D324FBB
MLHLDAGANLVEAVLEVRDVTVTRYEDVDATGVGGGQDVVIVGVPGTGNISRVPSVTLASGKLLSHWSRHRSICCSGASGYLRRR